MIIRRVAGARAPAGTRAVCFTSFGATAAASAAKAPDSSGDGYELIVHRPNALVSIERLARLRSYRRWRQIERTLVREGWQGPHARSAAAD